MRTWPRPRHRNRNSTPYASASSTAMNTATAVNGSLIPKCRMTAGNLEPSSAADAAAAVYALPSPLDAIGDLRAAARWTIAAFGVVGTALIGGGPLVAVGKIHHPANAVIAGADLLVAVIGIGVAIWTTGRALPPPVTTLATLDSPSPANCAR